MGNPSSSTRARERALLESLTPHPECQLRVDGPDLVLSVAVTFGTSIAGYLPDTPASEAAWDRFDSVELNEIDGQEDLDGKLKEMLAAAIEPFVPAMRDAVQVFLGMVAEEYGDNVAAKGPGQWVHPRMVDEQAEYRAWKGARFGLVPVRDTW